MESKNEKLLELFTKRSLLAESMVRKYLSDDWHFTYDRAVRRLGACNFNKKRISVSKHFVAVATEYEFSQTLLHEIAHALTGPEAGHGAVWLSTARKIGYEGGRTSTAKLTVQAPWQGYCPAGHKHERFKRPTRGASCGVCSKTFSPAHIIQWEYRR